MQKLSVILLVLGAVIGGLALFVGFNLFPKKFKEKVSEQGKLVNGTARWASWEAVPIPIFQKLYIFNVTNPQDVKKGGKPILDQLGPFIYQQKRFKTDIKINEENDTIFYRQHDDFFYRPDMSNGNLEDRITVINLPYVGAVAKAIGMGPMSRYVVAEILNELPDEDLYVDITVDEFLFGGYYVPFMQDLSEMAGEQLLPNNTFGLYYNKNGSESAIFEIFSGVKDPSRFGEVISYDGITEMDWYSETQCNKINGSDGGLMPPFMNQDKDLYLFIPALCRSLKFSYESNAEILGIQGLRYTVPQSFLEDPKTNPENKCYCINPDEEFENCPKGGVWQVSSCRKGTPLVMSMPHFYSAPEYYRNQSIGLNPDKELHEMYMIFEPTTAMSIKVSIRVQMNIEIRPSKYFPKIKNIPAMLHPIFWFEQGAGLNEEKAELMKDKLFRVIAMVEIGTYVGIGVGCLLIVIAILLCICRSNSPNNTKYNPKMAALRKVSSFETDNMYLESPANAGWSKVAPNEKYTIIAQSPMRPRMPLPEEQPLILTNLHNGTSSFNTNPIIRTSSPPVVVAVYPKLTTDQQPQNSPFQQRYSDDVDSNGRLNNSSPPPTVSMRNSDALGVPFPQSPTRNEYSSTLSVDNAISDMDNTLKDIHETLSSYENL